MEQQVLAWIQQYGYAAIFLLLCFGIVGLPVPDETLLAFSGFMIYSGRLSLPLTFFTALAGSATGITLSYWLGRTFGLKLIRRYGRYLHIREEHITRAHRWFEDIGHWALTFGYYVPGVRHVTAYAAGMSDMAPHMFAIFAYAGAVIWVSTFLGLGYFLGERWEQMEKNVEGFALHVAIAVAILVVTYLAWRKWGRKKGR